MKKRKSKQRVVFISNDEQIPIGIRGIVVYCGAENKGGKNCEKCILHGYHELTSINLICRPTEDYPEEYKKIEQEYLRLKEEQK